MRLISAAKNGDPHSFEQLVESYMGRGIQVAIGYLGNRDDALDMAQEACYRVYQSLDRFHDGQFFAPWFFRILRNACLSFIAKGAAEFLAIGTTVRIVPKPESGPPSRVPRTDL